MVAKSEESSEAEIGLPRLFVMSQSLAFLLRRANSPCSGSSFESGTNKGIAGRVDIDMRETAVGWG